MSFNLLYRQGSFPRAYSSILAAIGRACVLREVKGCADFRIETDGKIVMNESQVMAACDKARVAMPPR
jgi:hypothetical protein